MVFCTRKTKTEKVGGHKQISFRSFKNYSVDEYEKALPYLPDLNTIFIPRRTQQTHKCSKSIKDILGQGVNYLQI